MAELKRNDEELTTADLARQGEKPQLVPPGTRDEMNRDEAVRDADRGGGIREMTNRRDNAEPIAQSRMATEKQNPGPMAVVAGSSPLFSEAEARDSRSRWSNIQTAFVDEPRRAVEDADSLVASVMKKMAEGFAAERQKLEKQWDRGEDVSTEDLRVALQRYRAFFDRLLKV